MHPKFLSLLCCPETGESLSLQTDFTNDLGCTIAGSLRSGGGRIYPIIRGVPRFVDSEQYAASFGYEWNRWPRVQFESNNRGKPMHGHTTSMWERITCTDLEHVSGKTLIDFGCGSGRFLDVIRHKGALAVGIDLSLAVDAARRNFADDVNTLIVQGDLLHPPFKPGTFDGGYTIGVLHHTPDPAAGLAELARIIKPSGWVSCCVYPKGGFYDYPSVERFRKFHAKLNPVMGHHFAMAYAFAAAYGVAPLLHKLRQVGIVNPVKWMEKNWVVSQYLKDPAWAVLEIFDAITPAIASTHTADEVRRWFELAGCDDITVTPWCPTSLSARRASQGAGRRPKAA